MRKHLLITVCVMVLIAFSTVAVYAQADKAVATKVESLSKDVKELNAKLDQVLENQEKILAELKSVKIFIRRM